MSEKVQLSYKYRLYPSKSQITKLEETFDVCRQVYNSLLNDRKYQYKVDQKSVSYYDQKKYFPVWKQKVDEETGEILHPELSDIHSTVLQNISKRVGLAFGAFFRRVENGETPGYPRTKGKRQYKSITYVQSGFGIVNGRLRLSKIGDVSIRLHRPIEGLMKTCTIRRYGTKWFVTFSVDQEQPEAIEFDDNAEIGIDVGIAKFAALSNGEFIDNPRFYQRAEDDLAVAQRKFDKVKDKHRSPERRHRKQVVSRIYEKIRNKRHNFVHQETRKIANRFGSIFMEKLEVDNMSKSPKPKPDPENEGQYLPNGASRKAGLNKSILDAAWTMFRRILTYKAENAGGLVILNNPAYTSQMCSCCGYIDEANRTSQSNFLCISCGHTENADTNAAKNQIAVGRYSIGSILKSPCL